MAAPTRESRLPELRLPRLERDEIVQTLSEIRLPERIAGLELPRVDPPDIVLPSGDDIRRAVDWAAIRVGLRRRRSPWPTVAGLLVVAGVVAVAVARTPAVRVQVDRATQKARERIAHMRAERAVIEAPPSEVGEPMTPSVTEPTRMTSAGSLAAAATGVGADAPGKPVAVGPGEASATRNGMPSIEEREAAKPV